MSEYGLIEEADMNQSSSGLLGGYASVCFGDLFKTYFALGSLIEYLF